MHISHLDGKHKSVSLRRNGGNHLDQSVLWHRDVIELLMPLNKITCDLVAASLPCIVSKKSLKQAKWKTFAPLEFSAK